jgi:fumarylacetoacetase
LISSLFSNFPFVCFKKRQSVLFATPIIEPVFLDRVKVFMPKNASALNETHDVSAISWVASAQESDFPIQNLPYAVFRRKGTKENFRIGVAIGDNVLDMAAAAVAQAFSGDTQAAITLLKQSSLNAFMSLGAQTWSDVRLAIFRGLKIGSPLQAKLRGCLVAMADVEYQMPAQVGDYTDFFTSIHHASTVGSLFRPDNPLMPNYKWVPIGYHGRSSSLRVSGFDFKRPQGQRMLAGATEPSFGPSLRLDYELEMGVFVGSANALGEPIGMEQAEQHLFGMVLLNDWSARDIQAWEYQPLGPFLAKSFCTSISPWVVTMEALLPFRCPWERPEGDPKPLAYLDSQLNSEQGAIDIDLEVLLQTSTMRAANQAAERVSTSNFKHAYWSIAQMLAHHTSNGCNLQAGDLLGTGTQSGPTPAEGGCLLELTMGGKNKIKVASEERAFLEDGDTVTFNAHCKKDGFARIGFGECAGTVIS